MPQAGAPRAARAFDGPRSTPTTRRSPAFLKVNEARNWNDFTAALRDFVVPSQNFVYGDVDGHIGYYAPGRIPIRARGDGSLPVDGSSGDDEWTGWIPFDKLPHACTIPPNTSSSRPTTIRQRATTPTRSESTGPSRIERRGFSDLLSGRTTSDVGRFRADPGRHRLAPRQDAAAAADAARATREPGRQAGARHPAAVGRGHARREQRGRDLRGVVSAAHAGDRRRRSRSARDGLVRGAVQLRHAVPREHAHRQRPTWCDDRQTPISETCDQAVTTALHDAVDDLTEPARRRHDPLAMGRRPSGDLSAPGA